VLPKKVVNCPVAAVTAIILIDCDGTQGSLIIIINNNVYGAVLMTMVTARVHPVHLMNAD